MPDEQYMTKSAVRDANDMRLRGTAADPPAGQRFTLQQALSEERKAISVLEDRLINLYRRLQPVMERDNNVAGTAVGDKSDKSPVEPHMLQDLIVRNFRAIQELTQGVEDLLSRIQI